MILSLAQDDLNLHILLMFKGLFSLDGPNSHQGHAFIVIHSEGLRSNQSDNILNMTMSLK